MLINPHPFSAMLVENQAHLRIMQTTDLHAHIFPYDYYNDRPIEGAGLARTAALIAAVRAQAINTLLLDGGDVLQGSALGDYMAFDRGLRAGDLHPVIAAMNRLGYDAAALGNHEFNFGLEFLLAAIERSAFPYLCANALTKRGADARRDSRLLPPYVLLDRKLRDGAGKFHPIRIGVLGLLPPQIVTWDETLLRGVIQSRDMVETAAALIPEMKEAGADIIIALAHTGIGAEQHFDGMENAGRPLARLPGIDAVALGHTHMLFPSAQFANRPGIDAVRGTLDGTPAVMAGFWGSHLGVIDLKLQRGGAGWQVLDGQSDVLPIATAKTAGKRHMSVVSVPFVLKAAQAEHEATLEYMRFAIGATRRPLHSYFAQVKDCATVQIVCRAQRNYIAKKLAGTEHARLPLLSAAAPFKVGGWGGAGNFTQIPAGPMYQRSVADLYCFPNTICALRLRGADIMEWLERSAVAFHQIVPGQQDQPLLNDDFPSYNFDIIYGLTYEIDPTQPARYSVAGVLQHPESRRIRNLRYQGQTVDPEAEFVVATNNYRASTHLALRLADTEGVVFESSVTIRNILLNEIANSSPLEVTPEPNWQFTPMPGTSAVFLTSPHAAQLVTDLTDLKVVPLGETDGGFWRFRLLG
ncbi:bifunctional 2',3'-cyclic-nucleotide 2'-phosphodiesterase/3'-nucleotidase [Pseudorhodobacter sp.]|uniref:bifunctional 2',3'-cyclic-nucleotide 2'-phosphodiesterase/3'-nucleotidase n=1 Tax=Pseudorhodobacter sp. TaxID=1934400 RepID=UPI0039E30DBE